MAILSEFKGCLKKSAYPFPDDSIDPKIKETAQYSLEWMQAMTWAYFDNRCGTTYMDYNRIDEIRAYMDGRQGSAKYKDLFLGKNILSGNRHDNHTKEPIESEGFDREGWSDINFEDIYSVAPRYMNMLVGRFKKNGHDISCEALDEKSSLDRKKKKEQIWYNKRYKTQRDDLNKLLGVPPKDEVLPNNKQELDLFEKLGGTKLGWEIAMEKTIAHTLSISNWKEISDKFYRDLIAIGKGACMDMVYIDEQKVYAEYIDIQDLIIEYDFRTNFERSRFMAYPYWMTITQVIEETGMNEEDVVKFANSVVAGAYGNPQWIDAYSKKSNGNWLFGDWRVPVLYGAWITTNQYYNTKVKNKTGDKTYAGKFGKFHDGTGAKSTVVTSTECVYHAKWIPYSEVVWNYGMMNDIPRDENNNARLPVHLYWIRGKSIGEQMIPALDDMQIAHLNYQNNKAKSPPPGGTMDINALESINYAGKKIHPLELIKLYYSTGWFLYKRNKSGIPTNTTPPVPVQLEPGGNPIAVKEFADSLAVAINDLANLTGVDPITLAKEGGEAPVSNTKLGTSNMNDTLTPVYAAYLDIEESLCKNLASRIQIICMFDKGEENKGYADVIGKKGVEAIAAAGTKNHTRYGIKIFDKPKGEEKEALLKAIQIALTPGKSGVPGITPSQFSFLTRQMNIPGGMKSAEQMLAFWEKEKQEKDMQRAEANMEMNTKREAEAFQIKTQGQIELDNAKTDNKIRLAMVEAYVKGELQDAAMGNEIKTYSAKVLADSIANSMKAGQTGGQQGQPQQGQQPMQPPQGQPQQSASTDTSGV
jgi:hypothetical protein